MTQRQKSATAASQSALKERTVQLYESRAAGERQKRQIQELQASKASLQHATSFLQSGQKEAVTALGAMQERACRAEGEVLALRRSMEQIASSLEAMNDLGSERMLYKLKQLERAGRRLGEASQGVFSAQRNVAQKLQETRQSRTSFEAQQEEVKQLERLLGIKNDNIYRLEQHQQRLAAEHAQTVSQLRSELQEERDLSGVLRERVAVLERAGAGVQGAADVFHSSPNAASQQHSEQYQKLATELQLEQIKSKSSETANKELQRVVESLKLQLEEQGAELSRQRAGADENALLQEKLDALQKERIGFIQAQQQDRTAYLQGKQRDEEMQGKVDTLQKELHALAQEKKKTDARHEQMRSHVLQLRELRPSLGALRAELESLRVPAGEGSSIHVQVKWDGLQGALQKLQDTLRDQSRRAESREKELSTLQGRAKQLYREFQAQKASLEAAQTTIEAKNAELVRVSSLLDETRTQQAALSQELRAASISAGDLGVTNGLKDSQLSQLKTLVQTLQESLSQAEALSAQREARIEFLEQVDVESQAAQAQLQAANKALQEQLSQQQKALLLEVQKTEERLADAEKEAATARREAQNARISGQEATDQKYIDQQSAALHAQQTVEALTLQLQQAEQKATHQQEMIKSLQEANKKGQQQFRDFMDTNTAMQQDNQKLQVALDLAKADCERAKSQIAQLQDQLKQKDSGYEQLSQKAASTAALVREKEQALAAKCVAEQKLNEQVRELTAKTQQLQGVQQQLLAAGRDKNQMEEMMQNQAQETRHVRQELLELTQKFSDCQLRKNQLDQMWQQSQTELNTAKSQRERVDVELKGLAQQLQEKTALISKLQTTVGQLTESNEGSQIAAEKAQQRVKTCEEQIASLTSQIDQNKVHAEQLAFDGDMLKQNFDMLKQKSQQLLIERDDALEAVRALRKSNEKLEEDGRNQKQELDKMAAQCQAQEGLLSQATVQIKRLQEQFKATQTQTAEFQSAQEQQHQKQVGELQAQIQALQQSMRQKNVELQALNAESARQGVQTRQQAQQLEARQAQQAQLIQELSSAQQKQAELQQQNEQLSLRNKQLESAVDLRAKEVAAWQQQFAGLQSKYDDKTSRLLLENDAMKQQVCALEIKLKTSERDAEQLRADIFAGPQPTHIAHLSRQVNQLQVENSALKQETSRLQTVAIRAQASAFQSPQLSSLQSQQTIVISPTRPAPALVQQMPALSFQASERMQAEPPASFAQIQEDLAQQLMQLEAMAGELAGGRTK